MATVIYIVVSILVILGLIGFIAAKLTKKPEEKSLTTPTDHQLIQTWVGRTDGLSLSGWKWKCSCGTQGTASNAKEDSSLGSENNAIERFKDHASLYRDVNGNEWKDKYFELKNVFDKYKEKCYCKDTNADLKAIEDDLKYGQYRGTYIDKEMT